MTAGSQPGLREQNKARTRAAIRSAALELIAEQGYQATTVAQIAKKAGVSHTTLFRYFESKEQVILSDDFDDAHRRILDHVPPGLNHFDLLRRTVTEMFRIAADDPWVTDPQRLALILTEPALRMAHQIEADRAIQEMTAFFAEYIGVPEDSFALRVFVAAGSGVMMHIAERSGAPSEDTLTEFLDALDLLEKGLPLS
ncbi:MAG: TetR family transcriptional regulator [Gordonia sp. (in: high G+C Gram-positive bacteria)]|uniref:TetR/AcrR family transcriptional regulator n=1 Tax=Gordonia sp. (in: high G+C Gram-positive bacteria) TaxID=84139 RepID=UPI0039E5FF4F